MNQSTMGAAPMHGSQPTEKHPPPNPPSPPTSMLGQGGKKQDYFEPFCLLHAQVLHP